MRNSRRTVSLTSDRQRSPRQHESRTADLMSRFDGCTLAVRGAHERRPARFQNSKNHPEPGRARAALHCELSRATSATRCMRQVAAEPNQLLAVRVHGKLCERAGGWRGYRFWQPIVLQVVRSRRRHVKLAMRYLHEGHPTTHVCILSMTWPVSTKKYFTGRRQRAVSNIGGFNEWAMVTRL